MSTSYQIGQQAEQLATCFLKKQGVNILEKNFRVRGGEIDLICTQNNILIFVEVRLRRSSSFGNAAESISMKKQQRIIIAAQHYLVRQPTNKPCRFDCILLDQLSLQSIQWISDAFRIEV